jgi:TolA-binding protein
MTHRFPGGLVVLCLLHSGLGCWVPAETGKKMQADILALQDEVREANKGLDEQRAAFSEQIQAAKQQLADLSRAAHMTDADFGVQIERLIREMQELRGTLELTEYRLSKIEAKLEGPGSLDERLDALEKQAVGTPPTPISSDIPTDKKELLVYARKLVKEGKVNEARGVYRDLIKRFANEPGVTDEAHFRLGELYYDEKKYRSAMQEFIKVAEHFASGKLVDDALYKIGICSMDLGRLEDAQIFFQEIAKNHRRSPFVRSAKAKLDEIAKRLEKEKTAKRTSKKGRKR